MSQAESPAKVSKSQQVVMSLPPTLGAMVQVVQPALDRLAIGEPGLRLLVLVPDADTAHALAAAVRPAADTPPLLVPVTSTARGVRLLGQAPVALVGAPREIASLLPSGQLKLAGLAQFLLLQADLTLALADAADVEAIVADLPKELPRTLTTAVETDAVAAFVKSYLKRPRRVGDDVVADDARPLSIQYVPVASHTRALALRRVLDHANAPSAIVVANDENGRDEAAAALRVLGYAATPESHVRAEAGTATEHSVLRVLWDVPATRAALEGALSHAPTQAVVLSEPRQIAHLRALLAGGSLAQLVLTESLADAERREAQRTAQLTAVLAGGLSVAELRAVEGLLAEHDAIEIAAAALRLLDQELATVRALRIGVTTATPKPKAEATPAPAQAPAPRARASRAADVTNDATMDTPSADAPATADAASDAAPLQPIERIEQDEAPAPLPRASRRNEPATTTGIDEWKLVWINVGARDGATPASLVGAITGESGLDRGVIGAIDLRDTHTLVEIAADNAEQVVGALTGSVIRGRDITARIDQVGGRIERAGRDGRGAPRGGRDDRGPRSGGRPFQRREDGGFGGGRPSFTRDDRGPRGGGGARPFQRRDEGDAARGRPFQRRDDGGAGGGRPFQRRDEGGFGGGRPFQRDDRGPRGGGSGGARPFQRRDDGDAPRGRPFQRREEGSGGGRPFQRDDRGPRGGAGGGYPRRDRDDSGAPPRRGFDRRPDDFAERAERLQRSRRPAPGERRPFTRGDVE